VELICNRSGDALSVTSDAAGNAVPLHASSLGPLEKTRAFGMTPHSSNCVCPIFGKLLAYRDSVKRGDAGWIGSCCERKIAILVDRERGNPCTTPIGGSVNDGQPLAIL